MKTKLFAFVVILSLLLQALSMSNTLAAPDTASVSISSPNTIINDYAYLVGNELADDNVVVVNDSSSFAVGDEILIIQMQTEAGGVAGEHEFATITGITGNELTLSGNLQRAYYSGEFDSETATASQVVRVPNYTEIIINSDASIAAPAWNGYSGGIIALKAQTSLTNNGSINANAKGYRGGDKLPNQDMASPGESYTGISIALHQTTANDGGGGYGNGTSYAAGGNGAHGGGGGGHQTTGQNGELSDGSPTTAPEGGISYSDAASERLTFGSGGGAGGVDSYQQVFPTGGNGGGLVVILSPTIVNNGTITANGADGESPSGGLRGGAGGGAGGYVYFVTNSSELGTVEVNGGSGGQSSIPSRGSGGAGGTGYYLSHASNQDPIAEDDIASSDEETPATIDVLANDSDPDGDLLTVTSVTQGMNGTVVIDPAKSTVTYTPNAGFTGTDSFTYTISDGQGGTDTATVTVIINPSFTTEFKLTASDPGTADYFAKSVDIDGTFAIVGALYHDEVAPNSGAAYIIPSSSSST